MVGEGIKPTTERVRQRLGGGSPNTASAMLDEWFARLPTRLIGAQSVGRLIRSEGDAGLAFVVGFFVEFDARGHVQQVT